MSTAETKFIPPLPENAEAEEIKDALPVQEEYYRPPVRFGSIPVEKEPLGWDKHKGYRKLYPQVSLPIQVVDRVSFGHPQLEPNRLFWGDNLHIMRQLPSESVDLIYIDPPFFSGRQYNVIFGDQNELRSFSDIWEGGMPGYLIWLNARLVEMKRLLKKTGSIYVHLDWHASHYVKVEMDKIFGHDNFRNEIVWRYKRWSNSSSNYQRMHDIIFFYSKTNEYHFNTQYQPYSQPEVIEDTVRGVIDGKLVRLKNNKGEYIKREKENKGVACHDVFDIQHVQPTTKERIGYPTQKPEKLLERIIIGSTDDGDTVADFFCGGGTTPAVAQRLNRRWIAADQSRVAVALTADRVAKVVEEKIGKVFAVPDFTVEHWGVYEVKRLADTPLEQFRDFVLRAFGAVPEIIDKIDKIDKIEKNNSSNPVNPVNPVESEELDKINKIDKINKNNNLVNHVNPVENIHGYKGAVPVWVGEADMRTPVTAKNVQDFANAIRRTLRYQQDNLRDGIMLAWAFRPDAIEAAERLRRLENTDLNFIRLEQIRIDSPRFRQNVVSLSTEKADYANFLTFVQPPKVEVGYKRIAEREYKFDVSETIVMNPGAKIINVQWDFNYGKRFTSTQGYSFIRGKNKEPELQTQYKFSSAGEYRIACKVQDDMGGEGIWSDTIAIY